MGVSEDDLLLLEADVDAEVETATNEAKAGGIPGEDLLLKDVWADGGASWRN
jgi:pyruvate dehydrogenase E1 component alpha subunit